MIIRPLHVLCKNRLVSVEYPVESHRVSFTSLKSGRLGTDSLPEAGQARKKTKLFYEIIMSPLSLLHLRVLNPHFCINSSVKVLLRKFSSFSLPDFCLK